MSRYGANLTPSAGPTGSKFGNKARTSRGKREPSGVFTLFQPAQVQQFREAFSLIDQDGDGLVSDEDLKRIFASLGTYCRLLLSYPLTASSYSYRQDAI
jgi:myosin regulatory light chain 12